MSASNPDWSEMWVWRASSRRAETARMAILTAGYLFVTGPLDRRTIATLHESAHLGSERIDELMQATDTADQSLKLPRTTISAISWHRTTRVIEIERVGLAPIRLHCAESESTEEIGRGLQKGMAPTHHPESVPATRGEMVRFEMTKGKGRVPLLVASSALLVMIVCFALGAVWVALLAAAVAAVALVGVAAVIRDADLSVPYYRVEVTDDDDTDDPAAEGDESDDTPVDEGSNGLQR